MRTRMMALAVVLGAGALVVAGEHSFPYMYKRGDTSMVRISGGFDRIGAISRKYGAEFVWLRLNGRSYVIRDAQTLAEVREAFRPVEELHPAEREIERRLDPIEREFEEIEERVDTLSDSLDDDDLSDSEREAIEAKLRVAEVAMREVEKKMRPIEQEMERLEKESERREEIAEDRFEKIVKSAVARGIAEQVE